MQQRGCTILTHKGSHFFLFCHSQSTVQWNFDRGLWRRRRQSISCRMNELLMLPWHTEGQAPLAVSKIRLGMKPNEIFMTTPNPVVVILCQCQPTLLGQLWRCHWSTIHSSREPTPQQQQNCLLSNLLRQIQIADYYYTNSELVMNPILDSSRFDDDTSYIIVLRSVRCCWNRANFERIIHTTWRFYLIF